jgi:hypothetical protein
LNVIVVTRLLHGPELISFPSPDVLTASAVLLIWLPLVRSE